MEKVKNKIKKEENVDPQNHARHHGTAGPTLKARLTNKEWVLSSFQYATGWLMLLLFTYGFVLQFFIKEVPYIPVLSDYFVPLIMVTFFTHATLGIRSTTMRYHVYQPWLDLVFLPLWIFVCVTFLLTYARLAGGF